jgi:hypothetical protein
MEDTKKRAKQIAGIAWKKILVADFEAGKFIFVSSLDAPWQARWGIKSGISTFERTIPNCTDYIQICKAKVHSAVEKLNASMPTNLHYLYLFLLGFSPK